MWQGFVVGEIVLDCGVVDVLVVGFGVGLMLLEGGVIGEKFIYLLDYWIIGLGYVKVQIVGFGVGQCYMVGQQVQCQQYLWYVLIDQLF